MSAAGGAATRFADAPRYGLALVLLLGAALWPMLVFRDLPLQDYPNHLARAYILLHAGDPVLAANYRIVWSPVPDLGFDLWVLATGRFLPLAWVGKSFVAFGCALTISGCAALNRLFSGKLTPTLFLAVPFLFNTGFEKGFLNFGFGIGLALWAMAWWVWVPERHWRFRLAVATVASTALYTVHLFAWASYGIFVLGFELQKVLGAGQRKAGWRLAGLGRDGIQALPAIGLAAWSAGTADGLAGGVGGLESPLARVHYVSTLIDVGYPALNTALLSLLCAFLAFAYLTGRLRFTRKAALPLVFFAGLFFLIPNAILGTVNIPWRVLVPVVFLAFACARDTAFPTRRFAMVQFGFAGCLTLSMSFLELGRWRHAARQETDLVRVIEPMPNGSKLFCAHAGGGFRKASQLGTFHTCSYAVMAKRALVQSLFVFPGQQILRFRDTAIQQARRDYASPFLPAAASLEDGGSAFRAYVQRFDYVLLQGADAQQEAAVLPSGRLGLVAQTGDLRLFRVLAQP